MTDKEVNYRAMARQDVQKLTYHRKLWEPAAPRGEKEEFEEMAAEYKKARAPVDGGHGPKPGEPTPAVPKS